MPKRENKFIKKITIYFILGIFCFYIYYVFLRNKEYQIPDINNYDFTNNINDTLFLENYSDGFNSEVYLTDSINFRLFIMNYIFEHQQFCKFTINKESVNFYKLSEENPFFKKTLVKSYTFEELKTKNNLRKKK